MNATEYAVRRANASERGRWVICRNGFPNDVKADGFLFKYFAVERALKWKRRNEKSAKMYPV
jgi:hypothetical protein